MPGDEIGVPSEVEFLQQLVEMVHSQAMWLGLV